MSDYEKYMAGNTTSCYCPNCPPESEPYKIYYMDKIEMRDAKGVWHTFPVEFSGSTFDVLNYGHSTSVNTSQYLVSGGNITAYDVGVCLSCDPSRPLDPYFIHATSSGVAHGSTKSEWKKQQIRDNHYRNQMRKYQDMSGHAIGAGENE